MSILTKLSSGFRRFRQQYYINKSELIAALIQKQSPRALVIACCDSRVHPDTIFDTELGDLFVVRNIANIVLPYKVDRGANSVDAALTFAVLHLGVTDIIVCGHSQCGGARRLLEVPDAATSIDLWVQQMSAVREYVLATYPDSPLAEQCHQCELAMIKRSLANLHSFPSIQERVEAQSLAVHGFYFDIKQGALLCLDQQTGQFNPIQTTPG